MVSIKFKDQTIQVVGTVHTQTKTTNKTEKFETKNGQSSGILKIKFGSALYDPLSIRPFVGNQNTILPPFLPFTRYRDTCPKSENHPDTRTRCSKCSRRVRKGEESTLSYRSYPTSTHEGKKVYLLISPDLNS